MHLAIIDATVKRRPPLSGPDASRYVTSIANLPLISHVFDELARAGVRDVRVVAEPSNSDDLRRILGDGSAWGIGLSWSDATDGGGRQAVLDELTRALAAGPVLLHPGDSLFRAQLRAMRERFRAGDVDSVLPEQAALDLGRDATEHRVADTALLLGPAALSVLAEGASAAGNGGGLVERLLHSDCRLAVCEAGEHWNYDESTDGLLAANRLLLDALPSSPPLEDVDASNEVNGRVAIGPGAIVSSCVMHGPISIDSGAVVEDSFIGPYTAIGATAVVSGTEIDNAMVLAGAEVRHPDYRIEGSIIGERSRVTRSFNLPKGLHLRLGPDSRITLS
jgi:glucose-1-phosphate thymidylyltransferase